MIYDEEILKDILRVRENWIVCDVWSIHEVNGEISMWAKFYKQDKYSILEADEYIVSKKDYFNHIRNKKLKSIINKI